MRGLVNLLRIGEDRSMTKEFGVLSERTIIRQQMLDLSATITPSDRSRAAVGELTLSTDTKARDLHQLVHPLISGPDATRRKLTPDTWPAISALHLIENRFDVGQKGYITYPATGLRWISSSRLPRSILAIAAGADFEHLALPLYWRDRSMSLDKGVSRLNSLAKYAVA